MVSHVCLLVVNVRVFRLLMKEVQNCGILEGDPKRRTFTCSLPFLMAQKYLLASQLLQWSIQHGGPGIPVLTPALYDYIVGVPSCRIVDDRDITDVHVKELIHKVSAHGTTFHRKYLCQGCYVFIVVC